jgi:glycosyltransferase involved in cell wall biosynthesis
MEIMSAITIIVPIYNTEKYLDRCIRSIISQTFTDIEILLINDGSTDNSLNMLSDYAQKDNRITVISQENRGLPAARNRGIKTAASPYILHVDSDDWIEADMCELLYNAAVKNSADIVTSHVYFEHPNKRIVKKEPYPEKCGFQEFLEIYAARRGINSVCNKLIKRDLYMANNIEHYEDISLGEDSSALLRLIIFANTVVTVDKAFYHYDIKMSSMTAKKNKKVMEYINGLSRVEACYQENGIGTGLFPLLRYKIAYKLLAGCSFSKAKKFNYSDYCLLYNKFYNEIDAIIKHRLFHTLCFTDKCYAFAHSLLRRLSK